MVAHAARDQKRRERVLSHRTGEVGVDQLHYQSRDGGHDYNPFFETSNVALCVTPDNGCDSASLKHT